MNKIKNLADLRELKEKLQSKTKLRDKSEAPDQHDPGEGSHGYLLYRLRIKGNHELYC